MNVRETVLARPAVYWTGLALGLSAAVLLSMRGVMNGPTALEGPVLSDSLFWIDPAVSALGLVVGIATVGVAARLRRARDDARASFVAWIGAVTQAVVFATLFSTGTF